MRKIINQYLFKEVAQAWLGVTLILLAILITNQFAKILGDASSGNLSGNVIAELLLYSSIEYLTILLPLSSFLAILLVFGRLYKDSEMAAIMASGVGPLSLYRPLILPTYCWLLFWVWFLVIWPLMLEKTWIFQGKMHCSILELISWNQVDLLL